MQTQGKPFSQACENNKTPILDVLKKTFGNVRRVLEIGSGTGQHACHFARSMPHLQWQPTDKTENLSGIRLWVQDANLTNLLQPIALDVMQTDWPCLTIEALFTANTLHIMAWQEVETMFSRLEILLKPGAPLCIYGPFNYGGRYTSLSNADFDRFLKSRDPASGIRDIEAVTTLARRAGLVLREDNTMPANNRLLVWEKVE
ncbi:MAG: DUF938 domain-containing protein [Gammaproteobacteria bacterium]